MKLILSPYFKIPSSFIFNINFVFLYFLLLSIASIFIVYTDLYSFLFSSLTIVAINSPLATSLYKFSYLLFWNKVIVLDIIPEIIIINKICFDKKTIIYLIKFVLGLDIFNRYNNKINKKTNGTILVLKYSPHIIPIIYPNCYYQYRSHCFSFFIHLIVPPNLVRVGRFLSPSF